MLQNLKGDEKIGKETARNKVCVSSSLPPCDGWECIRDNVPSHCFFSWKFRCLGAGIWF